LEKRAKQVLPGSERVEGEREGVKEGVGAGKRNCPNNACTYE
jgi:hypothetical protein